MYTPAAEIRTHPVGRHGFKKFTNDLKMVSVRCLLAAYMFAFVQLAVLAEPWKEASDPKTGKVF